MSADAAVQIAVGVLRAIFEVAPEAYEAMRGEKVGDVIARGRAALPAPGSTSAAVETVIARHVAALHPQVTHATADVLGRIHGVTLEERHALDAAIAAVRAVADARDLPPVIGRAVP